MSLNMSELHAFFAWTQTKLDEKFGKNESTEMHLLSCMLKLTEEVGELAEQVNKMRSRQEDRKWLFDKDDAAGEIADVIFCVWLLAQAMEIDLEDALVKKMEKIRTRLA